jgi:hypothetical protein
MRQFYDTCAKIRGRRHRSACAQRRRLAVETSLALRRRGAGAACRWHCAAARCACAGAGGALHLRAVEALGWRPGRPRLFALRHGLIGALRRSGWTLQAELSCSRLRDGWRGQERKRQRRCCDQCSHGSPLVLGATPCEQTNAPIVPERLKFPNWNLTELFDVWRNLFAVPQTIPPMILRRTTAIPRSSLRATKRTLRVEQERRAP